MRNTVLDDARLGDAMPSSPKVSAITEADFAEVAAFATRQARAGEPIAARALSPEDRLRWLLLENPARSSDIPFGWCVREEVGKAIVSTLLCVPFRVGVGDFSCTALVASKFYADPRYRGAGIGPLMRFVQEGRRFPLLVTSANELAGELYRKCGAYQIEAMDHTMLGVRKVGPLAEEWFFRRTGSALAARVLSCPARLMRRALGGSSIRGELTLLRSQEAGVSPLWARPREVLAVIRDADYLRWRYFAKERGKEVYRFHLTTGEDRLVVVRLTRSGHRSQIRVLDVLDIWPPADAEAAVALAGALAGQYAGAFDVIWLRSQPDEAERMLGEIGFIRHAFPAPLGWCIDSAGVLPTNRWYLMPGEAE
jgi:GNAT superfamily N-acetyltransferase